MSWTKKPRKIFTVYNDQVFPTAISMKCIITKSCFNFNNLTTNDFHYFRPDKRVERRTSLMAEPLAFAVLILFFGRCGVSVFSIGIAQTHHTQIRVTRIIIRPIASIDIYYINKLNGLPLRCTVGLN